MFLQDGLPLAVSPFNMKHIIVKEFHNELVNSNGIHEYRMVEKYYIDSILYYYQEPLHTCKRFSIDEVEIDSYKNGLKDRSMRDLLDAQSKPPLHECYALLALREGKKKLRGIFST